MREACSLIWSALVLLFRSRSSLAAEILVLRHQINILRRHSPQRQTFSTMDRLIFAGLYRLDSSCRLLVVVRGSDANRCRYRCAHAETSLRTISMAPTPFCARNDSCPGGACTTQINQSRIEENTNDDQDTRSTRFHSSFPCQHSGGGIGRPAPAPSGDALAGKETVAGHSPGGALQTGPQGLPYWPDHYQLGQGEAPL